MITECSRIFWVQYKDMILLWWIKDNMKWHWVSDIMVVLCGDNRAIWKWSCLVGYLLNLVEIRNHHITTCHIRCYIRWIQLYVHILWALWWTCMLTCLTVFSTVCASTTAIHMVSKVNIKTSPRQTIPSISQMRGWIGSSVLWDSESPPS